jgi:2-methylcitrate dehydratase PrpD
MADGDFPNRYGARVTVRSRSSGKFTSQVEDVRGTPGRPISAREALGKFYDCTLPVLRDDAPERLVEAIEQLHRAEDLAALTSALRSVR